MKGSFPLVVSQLTSPTTVNKLTLSLLKFCNGAIKLNNLLDWFESVVEVLSGFLLRKLLE